MPPKAKHLLDSITVGKIWVFSLIFTNLPVFPNQVGNTEDDQPGGTFRFSRVSMVWHHLIQLTFASLHFQLLLNIPRSNLKSRGDRAFSFVAPNWRNNRSFHIKATHSLSRFKTLLKTYLFLLAISSSWYLLYMYISYNLYYNWGCLKSAIEINSDLTWLVSYTFCTVKVKTAMKIMF